MCDDGSWRKGRGRRFGDGALSASGASRFMRSALAGRASSRRAGALAGRASSRRAGALAGRASSRRTGGRALPCTRWGSRPRPLRCLRISISPAGGTGFFCGLRAGCVQHDQPAIRTAGWSAECPAGWLPLLLRGGRDGFCWGRLSLAGF